MIRSEKGTPDQNAARTLLVGCVAALLILVFGNWVTSSCKAQRRLPCSVEQEASGMFDPFCIRDLRGER